MRRAIAGGLLGGLLALGVGGLLALTPSSRSTSSGSGAVDSVFGRTGVVAADAGDYSGIYQGADADLTTYAGVTPGAGGLAVLDDASVSAVRTTLALVPGTDVQVYDADLAALAGLTSAANKVPTWSGSGTAANVDIASTTTANAIVKATSAGRIDPTWEGVTYQTITTANTTSDTTGASTGVALAMTAGKTYLLEAVLNGYTNGSTTGLRFALVSSGGLAASYVAMWEQMNGQAAAALPGGYATALDTWTVDASGSGAAADRPIMIHAVVVATVSGTATLQFRSETSGNRVDVTGPGFARWTELP